MEKLELTTSAERGAASPEKLTEYTRKVARIVEDWDGAAGSPNVIAALLQRGYSEDDFAKIWDGNLLRVMRDVQSEATNQ